jgi:hypothetical protein
VRADAFAAALPMAHSDAKAKWAAHQTNRVDRLALIRAVGRRALAWMWAP